MIIDTHSHLYSRQFDQDRAKAIERAKKEGVKKIFLPAIDSETHADMIQMETDFPGICIAMMGLHPCSVKEDYKTELAQVQEWLKKRRFAAVGEIGLDFYWDRNYDVQQYEAFHQQILWALDYDLPIVIHSRESTQACIDVVKQHQNGKLKGIFHCFSGTAEEAAQVIDNGFLLGIGGVITFKKSTLPEIVEATGLEHIVLETDAPYLAPVPFRGKRNESSYLKYVVEKIAEIKKISKEEVSDITTRNAEKIFGN